MTDEMQTNSETNEPTTIAVRAVIREWWRSHIDNVDAVSLPTLATVAVTELRADPAFCAAFLNEMLRSVVYDEGVRFLEAGRRETRARLSATEAAERIGAERADWSRWLEHDPASGTYVRFLRLTKEQALAAAEAREGRADAELRDAALLRLAAGRCAFGQHLDEVWTEEGLADIERRLVISRPSFSLSPTPIMDRIRAERSA